MSDSAHARPEAGPETFEVRPHEAAPEGNKLGPP
jgi:hypothetical protein